MAYLTVDDNLSHHRKLLRAGDVAAWLFVCGLCYCQRHSTDGFIPDEAVAFLGCAGWRAAAPKLVDGGLWEIAPGGYQVHDFLDWNDSAADRRAKTDASNARVTRYRERMKRAGSGVGNTPPIPRPTPTPEERTTPPETRRADADWRRCLAIAHAAIEAHPASMPDQADWFKQRCASQGLDYAAVDGEGRALYTRALDAAQAQRDRRAHRARQRDNDRDAVQASRGGLRL